MGQSARRGGRAAGVKAVVAVLALVLLTAACTGSGPRAANAEAALVEERSLVEAAVDTAVPGVAYDGAAYVGSCARTLGVTEQARVAVIVLLDPAEQNIDDREVADRILEFWRLSGDPGASVLAEPSTGALMITAEIRDVAYVATIDTRSGTLRAAATSGCYVVGTSVQTLVVALVIPLAAVGGMVGLIRMMRRRRGDRRAS